MNKLWIKWIFLVVFAVLFLGGCQKQEVPVSNPEENQYLI